MPGMGVRVMPGMGNVGGRNPPAPPGTNWPGTMEPWFATLPIFHIADPGTPCPLALVTNGIAPGGSGGGVGAVGRGGGGGGAGAGGGGTYEGAGVYEGTLTFDVFVVPPNVLPPNVFV